MADKEETRIIRIEIDTGPTEKAAISIQSLTEANKKLREERKKLDLTTKEGQESIDRINQSLDRNDKLIKQNSSSLEKQRLNVGNYTKSIKDAIPGLDAMTGGAASAAQGIVSMTKAGLAFIATPVGAILAAIGVALAALTAYFRGSEEGQDKLNKVMQIGSAIFERFNDVLEAVGKALVGAFENPKQAMSDLYEFVKQNLINRFTAFKVILDGIMNLDFKQVANGVIQVSTGVENAIDKVQKLGSELVQRVSDGIDQGAEIAARQKDIRTEENKLAINSANVALAVGKLKEKAAFEEGEQKKKTIQEAIALEQTLSDQTVALAEKKRDLAKRELEINGDDINAIKALNDAEVALTNARTTRFDNTIKFQKELSNLNEKELADNLKKQEQLKKDAEDLMADLEKKNEDYAAHVKKKFEIDQAYNAAKQEQANIEIEAMDLKNQTDLEAYNARLLERYDLEVANERATRDFLLSNTKLTEEEKQTIRINSVNNLNAINADYNQKEIEGAQKVAAYEAKLQAAQVRLEAQSQQLMHTLVDTFLKKGSSAHKIASHALISMDAIKGSMGAYAQAQEAYVPPYSWIIGGISAGIVTAMGIAAHAKLDGITFAQGGYVTGPGTTTSDSIPARLSDKEYVLRASAVRAVGVPFLDHINEKGYADGGLVTNQAVASTNDWAYLANMIRGLPPPQLGLKEFHEFDDRVQLKQTMATA